MSATCSMDTGGASPRAVGTSFTKNTNQRKEQEGLKEQNVLEIKA